MSSTKTKTLSIGDYHEIVKAYHKESGRAAAILACAFLESYMTGFLKTFFRSDPAVDDLFNKFGPLSTFSARINIAYAMKLISANTFHDLKYIQKIRNHFAHNPGQTSFARFEVIKLCQNLSTWGLRRPKGGKVRPRIAYLYAVSMATGQMHNTMLEYKRRKSVHQSTPADAASPGPRR